MPHTKTTVVLYGTIRESSSVHPAPPKELPCLPRLLILHVSPQVESLLNPPQTSQSLPTADDLDISPALFEDFDVASLEVIDHDSRTSAGLGIRVENTRSIEDVD